MPYPGNTVCPDGCKTVLRCTAMDAAQALADLTEVSSQIEAAILTDGAGKVLASTIGDPARSERFARAVHELLRETRAAHGESRERLVQLEAALSDGCVFVVLDGERAAACVTPPDPTVGLVFYDLRTCLRLVAGEDATPKPRPRTRRSEEVEAPQAEAEAASTSGKADGGEG